MDVTLQKHEAKHIYRVPEGLRELCTDISREVLRSQPVNLYAFIAEYVDTLLITRENTKIAVRVVNNILLGSQAILCILYRTGFTLEQIAVAAPRIQKAFREYLDAVDTQPTQICDDKICDEKSMISIRTILEATGASREDAEAAATVIQAAFRGHYERMALNEAQGKVQWQRAVTNTLDILKAAGATQAEIMKAARFVKFAYRGYYTRRNQRIDAPGAEDTPLRKDERILEPVEAIQAVAWMEMMYNDAGLTLEKANEAATIIQRAYKKYREKRRCYDVQKLETTKTMVAEAIIDNLHHRIFDKMMSREDIPEMYGTREEIVSQTTMLKMAFKEHLRLSRMSQEGRLESGEPEKEDESMEGEGYEEGIPTPPPPKPKYRPMEERLPPKLDALEEPSDAEGTTEPMSTSPDLQSEPDTERTTEPQTEPATETELEEETEDEVRREETVEEKEETEKEEGDTEPGDHTEAEEPAAEEKEDKPEEEKGIKEEEKTEDQAEEKGTDEKAADEKGEDEKGTDEKGEAEGETKDVQETGGAPAE